MKKESYRDLDKYKEAKRRQNRKYYRKTVIKGKTPNWTKGEDQLVLSHNITDRELSALIHRSMGAIQTRRYLLKKKIGGYNMTNKDYIKVFDEVMQSNGITRYFYNLEGYSDDKVCLECNNDNTSIEVYYGFRNSKDNLKRYDNNIEGAMLNIIERLSKSREQEEKIKKQFMDKIYNRE